MPKHPVDPDWFSHLRNPQVRLEWLSPLAASVDTIANFGCSSSEFLALLWYLDAAHIKVVEKQEESLSKAPMGMAPREELEFVRKQIPVALEGRSVQFVVEDMADLTANQVASDSCDLAYCEEVLYFIMPDLEKIQQAITQMARVVRPGGWVIAVETKIQPEVQEIENEFLSMLSGRKVVQCVPVGNHIDLTPFFEAAGLTRVRLDGAPEEAYCYKKPTEPPNTA